jgi:deoxyribose-phosphate aldolase
VTKLVAGANADFIKTSTGFGTRGASLRDVELFKENSGGKLLIKASGGIKDRATALEYVKQGITRIGTSGGVALMEEKGEVKGY